MSAGLRWGQGPVTTEGLDAIALLAAALAGDRDGFETILGHADLRAVTRILAGILLGAWTDLSGPGPAAAQLRQMQAQALAEAAQDTPPQTR